jgi:oligopeptide/dipeptide ABC transporter ATP-binding protein
VTDTTTGVAPSEPLLSVRDVVTVYETPRGSIRAADEVSFDVPRSGTVALVGESGSGKTAIALSIIGLLPEAHGKVVSGKILFEGRDLLGLDEGAMSGIRGAKIAMAMRDPMAIVDRACAVGGQIAELARIHRRLGAKAARDCAVDLLDRLGIASPDVRARALPSELSSGMLQRVMLAMALACDPDLLIVDDPTAQVDVTTQALILDLLVQHQAKSSMGILLLTHDLGVVAEFATDVVVLYAGRVVERGPVEPTFSDPLHPYTRALFASAPLFGAPSGTATHQRLLEIRGTASFPRAASVGCRFKDRCALRSSRPPGFERCDREEPSLLATNDGRASRCHYGGQAA